MSRAERVVLVERQGSELPLSIQAELLSLSRSSLYYYQLASPSAEEIAIKHRIDEVYTKYPFYGSRRITASLRRDDILVNRKAVQPHMQEIWASLVSAQGRTEARVTASIVSTHTC